MPSFGISSTLLSGSSSAVVYQDWRTILKDFRVMKSEKVTSQRSSKVSKHFKNRLNGRVLRTHCPLLLGRHVSPSFYQRLLTLPNSPERVEIENACTYVWFHSRCFDIHRTASWRSNISQQKLWEGYDCCFFRWRISPFECGSQCWPRLFSSQPLELINCFEVDVYDASRHSCRR